MRKYKLWSKELELTFWISKEECERGYLRSNVFDTALLNKEAISDGLSVSI